MKIKCYSCDCGGNIKCLYCGGVEFEEIKQENGYMGPGGYYKCLKCNQPQGYYTQINIAETREKK